MQTNEVEQALARLREFAKLQSQRGAHESQGSGPSEATINAVLAEHDRLRAELDRLTTPRPASEHEPNKTVLWWNVFRNGIFAPHSVSSRNYSQAFWTPIPRPRKESHEPQV